MEIGEDKPFPSHERDLLLCALPHPAGNDKALPLETKTHGLTWASCLTLLVLRDKLGITVSELDKHP
ncbi:hypothetical protein [Pantoea eucalypti]|uniref:hypothetical protein n=1 Tax=Pantoea eucalypti TaxID=470933 RepID=UPI00301BBAB1